MELLEMSERQKQHSTDEARGRYWHQMLNMADDDLDPYAYRLLGHYIRVDGCWETVRTTALVTRMSVGKVVKTRNALQDGGWINVELSEHDTYLITVIDRMKENVERYERLAREKKARSRGEHALNGVHEVNNDVHVVKNRKFKRVHEVKQRRTEEPREEELKDYAARSAAARATDLPPQVPETWSVADEGDEYQSLSVGKRAQATRTKRAKDKLQTTPPSSPDGARPPSSPKSRSAKQDQDAALVTALADAWGIPPANSDYGLYIRVARQMAKDIAPDQFKTFCAWRKQQAGDFADKLTIAR
jgi:hypothetical protein